MMSTNCQAEEGWLCVEGDEQDRDADQDLSSTGDDAPPPDDETPPADAEAAELLPSQAPYADLRPQPRRLVRLPLSTNIPVSTNTTPQNEPSVAVDLLNPFVLIVTANDYRAMTGLPRIGVYRSTDSGATFNAQLLNPLGGRLGVSDGIAAYGFRDLFLVAGLAYNLPNVTLTNGSMTQVLTDGSIVVYQSRNGGLSFGGPLLVALGLGTAVSNDKPALAIDTVPDSPFQGRAYVCYTRFSNFNQRTGRYDRSEIWFHRSTDQGSTWSPELQIDTLVPRIPSRRPDRRPRANNGAGLAIGRSGEVYAGWLQTVGGVTRFFVARSDDGGQTFPGLGVVDEVQLVPDPRSGPTNTIPWGFRTPTFAFLAADISPGRFAGRVYAVWQDYRFGQSDILLAYSDDQGSRWSDPVLVNPPAGIVSFQHFFPNIAVSRENGTVHVVYYNYLPTTSSLTVFLATSRDGGATFTNQPITDVPSNPNNDRSFMTPNRFIGDYIGLAIKSPTGFPVPVWTDVRTGSEDIFIRPFIGPVRTDGSNLL